MITIIWVGEWVSSIKPPSVVFLLANPRVISLQLRARFCSLIGLPASSRGGALDRAPHVIPLARFRRALRSGPSVLQRLARLLRAFAGATGPGAHLKLYLLITGSLFLTQTRLRAGDEALERGESRRSACHDVRPSNLVRAVDDCRGRGPGRSDYRGRFQSWRQTADLAQHIAHELMRRWHQSRHSRRAAAVGHQKTEFTITIRPADHRKIRPTEDFYFGTFGDTQPTAAECR